MAGGEVLEKFVERCEEVEEVVEVTNYWNSRWAGREVKMGDGFDRNEMEE